MISKSLKITSCQGQILEVLQNESSGSGGEEELMDGITQ